MARFHMIVLIYQCCMEAEPKYGAIKVRDFTNRPYRHKGVVDEIERMKNRTKSTVRAKIEHMFAVIKFTQSRQFRKPNILIPCGF